VLGVAVTQNDAGGEYHPFPGETVPAPAGLTDELK